GGSVGKPPAQVKTGGSKSGRPDSNRRRPAWEAGILPTELRPQGQTKMRAPPPRVNGCAVEQTAPHPTLYTPQPTSLCTSRPGSLLPSPPRSVDAWRPGPAAAP